MAIDRVRVNEGSTKEVTFTIRDQASAAVALVSLTGATLTLWDVETYRRDTSPTQGILNHREAQNVLNANNVTIHATSGLVTWLVQALDNVIITERRQIERHRAMFVFTWSGGSLKYELEIEVVNLRSVA